jgi:predicted DNA binding CopG/RHH family protein
MKPSKKIPKFPSEDQERKFWAKHDSSAYVDYSKAVQFSFPNLKPTSRAISIRLPESLLDSIKVIANRADVPYQSMMKILLDQKVSELRRQQRGKGSAT